MPFNDPIIVNGWTIVKMADTAPPGQPKYWDYFVYQEAILYQDVNNEETRAHINTTLESFAAHEFTHGNRIKPMFNSNLCTIRVTLSDRIGFSYIGRIAILHGFIPEHQLDKYRALFVNQNIANYQSLCQSELNTFFTELKKQPQKDAIEIDLSEFEEECINYDQYIALSNDQSQVVRNKQWPIITGGPPGTGKSIVLAKRLEQMLSEADPQIPLNILCVTFTRSLTEELKKMIYQDPLSVHHVQIIAYEDWILTFAPNRRLIDDEYLETWYHDYIDRRDTRHKAKLNKTNLFKESDKLNKDSIDTEAIKYMFKYYTGQDPRKTTDRDFLFPLDLRDEVIQLYAAWLDHLETRQLLHPAFFTIPNALIPEQLFDFSFIDETQLSTKTQVDNMIVCTKFITWMKRGVYLNYDSGQALMCHASHREELINKLIPNPEDIASHYQKLDIVFRSEKSIVQFVNNFLEKIKCILLPERADKLDASELASFNTKALSESLRSLSTDEQTTHSPFVKSITWVKDTSQIPDSYDLKSGHWGVITHKEHLETAIQHFGNAMTPLSTIGLSYRYIILFNFFDHEFFGLISKLLQQKKDPSVKVKFKRHIKMLVTILNAFYTAILRAEEHVLIVQSDHPHLKTLIDLLQLREFNQTSNSIDNTHLDIKKLEKRLITLILNKQYDVARREFTNLHAAQKLGMSYDAFESIHISKEMSPTLNNIQPEKSAPTNQPGENSPTNRQQSKKGLEKLPTIEEVVISSIAIKPKHLSPQSENEISDYLKNLYESLNDELLDYFFASGFAPKYSAYQVLNVNDCPKDLIHSIFADENKCSIFISYLSKHPNHLREIYLNYEDKEKNKIEHIAIIYHRDALIMLLKKHLLHTNERYNLYGETPLYKAFLHRAHNIIKLYENPFSQPLLQNTPYLTDNIIAIDYTDKEYKASYKKFSANPSGVWKPLSHLAGYNEFFEAVYSNDISAVYKLAKNNPKLAYATLGSKKIAGTHIAAQFGYSKMYELLIGIGTPPNLTTAEGWTALMIATRFCDVAMMRVILRTAEINFESNNTTALTVAMAYDNSESIMLLLHCSAHINWSKIKKSNYPSQYVSLISQELEQRKQFKEFIDGDEFSAIDFFSFCAADPELSFFSRILILSAITFEKIPFLTFLFWNGLRTDHICTYLELQIKSGKVDLIEKLMDPTRKYGLYDMSLMHIVAMCGNNRLLEIVFKFTTYPRNSIDEGKYTPLGHAIYETHEHTVELLLSPENKEHAYVEITVIDIFVAILKEVTSIFDRLIALANPDVLNDQSQAFELELAQTPLMYCVVKNKCVYAAKLTQQEGIDINLARTEDTKTALYLAAELNRLDILTLLLKQPGIQVDTQSKKCQYSPLMIATIKQYNLIAFALIDAGSDVNLLSAEGLSSLNYVCKTKNAKLFSLMIKQNGNINLQPGQKMSPLESCIRYHFFDGINILLNEGADLDIPSPLSTENSDGYITAESIAESIPNNEKITQRIKDERAKRACQHSHIKPTIFPLTMFGGDTTDIKPNTSSAVENRGQTGYVRR